MNEACRNPISASELEIRFSKVHLMPPDETPAYNVRLRMNSFALCLNPNLSQPSELNAPKLDPSKRTYVKKKCTK
jgi:hypothetical protein